MGWDRNKGKTDEELWQDRQKFFDPFSGSAGVDRDFDDPHTDELSIVERLRDRGHF